MKKAFAHLLATSATVAAGVALVPAIAAAQEQGAQAETGNSGFREIIVTAQRREEKLQDVPIAITALSADSLRERGVTQMQDLQSSVPSLVIAPNGQASRDVMSPSMRGQSAAFQGSPAVVVYMNEVPLPAAFTLSSQGGPGNFVDLQNVQVLAGVQGTLFGRNTTGGAILLTPAKPTDRFEGYVQGGYGNYDMKELEAVVNISISDRLKVRIVGAGRDRDGFTRDVNWHKDRDNQHWRMARIGVQWDPSDTISNYTMAYYGYSKTHGSGTIAKSFNTNYLTALNAFGFTFDAAYLNGLIAQQKDLGIRKTAHGVDDFAKITTWGVSNTTDIQLSEGLKLRNIASYAFLKSYYASDADATIAPVYDTGETVESRTSPRDYFRIYTEELQLQGEALDNKLTYTLGGFYFKQKPGGDMINFATNVCSQRTSAGCRIGLGAIQSRSESKALYAQATLDFGALSPALDRLRLTAGYRYTWDKVGGSNISYSYAPTAGYIGPVPGSPVLCAWKSMVTTNPDQDCFFGSSRKDSAGTWTLGLDYRPVDNLMLYAKVSRGYKAGGFNAYAVYENTRTFGPELVTDYEVGFKSDFKVGGAPVRLNVNGFYLDYSKIQRAAGDRNPTTGGNGAITLSTASAVIKGVEVEAMIKPVEILELGVNYSHLTSHYKSFKFNSNSGVYDCTSQHLGDLKFANADMTCRPLQYLSPNILSVHGRLNIPVPENVGNISLFASYNWTDAQDTAPLYVETFPDGSVMEPGVHLPSFGLLNASLDWRNVMGSNFDISVFGTNLADKKYAITNTGVYQTIGAQSQMYGEPRMYGVRVRYAFGGKD
ncbi:TonB-dependent receptor [Caenibius sp. WL]|uniref:TonB-dependent receptor n=1 Tax=Caenibius sp. WL TaxID=2872646 RepID=UPI001C9975CC|nr:TonB-dependent receptor [Caenibius sp. WL]QZP07541.1 TonB-dependent receptor [Caenibius sp. WL]